MCEYNRISSRRRFGRIAQILGELTQGVSADEASRKAITAINILSKDVGIPDGLIALGKKYGKEVREADIPTMGTDPTYLPFLRPEDKEPSV